MLGMESLAGGVSAKPEPWALPQARPFRVIENQFIPLSDGARLSARIWLPDTAHTTAAPAVLEYIPYRARDLERGRDNQNGAMLASRGIAFLRVDVRGSGESDGVIADEYLPQQQQDSAQIVQWIARQPWSNGAVGARGYSWGGIAALQLAALAPPALKAIMAISACCRRFTDDAHYLGGALLMGNFQWGLAFKTFMGLPPDPEIVGDGWEAMWKARLDAAPDILAQWLSHQREDSYWRNGSISPDFDKIKCPVYAVGGWADTYINQVPLLLEQLKGPRKGLIGPWGHGEPPRANPGPGLHWEYEEVRWWWHWLGGVETGLMREPMLRTYLPDRTASQTSPADTPGRWVAEAHWPSPAVRPLRLYLRDGALADTPSPAKTLSYTSDRVVGLSHVEWLPFEFPGDLPSAQSQDDAQSLVFDSAPLEADTEILGAPSLKLRLAVNRPVAKVAARLTEVTEDGKSWLVSYGLLNLSHRDGHENPQALEEGRFYDIEIPFYFTGYKFKKGRRLRLALSESLWPLVWPSPQVVTTTLELGACSLTLSVRTPRTPEAPFAVPMVANANLGAATPSQTRIIGPDADGEIVVRKEVPGGPAPLVDTRTQVLSEPTSWRFSMRPGDPNSCVWRGESSLGLGRDAWNCLLRSSFELRSSKTEFTLTESLKATRDGKVIFERTHTHVIARDLM